MNLFQNILQGIQERLQSSFYDYGQLASLVGDILRVPVSKEQIIVKGKVLFLELSPLLRSEVQIKKMLLLEKLKEHSFSFIDIRTTIR